MRYDVEFHPGFVDAFEDVSEYFRSNPAKQHWICPKQYKMPCKLNSSTLVELGNQLRQVLKAGDDAFQESNLRIYSHFLPEFFKAAVIQQLEELISELPGVEDFGYEDHRWHIEVKNVHTLSDPRLDSSNMDIVQYEPSDWSWR